MIVSNVYVNLEFPANSPPYFPLSDATNVEQDGAVYVTDKRYYRFDRSGINFKLIE